MNTKKKISIIVPIYNVERYITRCINSILDQAFTNYELILVNDGSTDSSLNICNSFADLDCRIKVYTKPNGGLSDARNFGLKYATGDYVCFIDSDDFVEANYLLDLYERITSDKTEVAICEYFLVNEDGKKYSKVSLNESKIRQIGTGKDVLQHLYEKNNVANIVAWNKLYKRTLFDNHRFEKGRLFEDEYMIVPLFWDVQSVSFVNKPLYDYVQRTGSITNSPLDEKKINDQMVFKKNRITFFENKSNYFCRLATYDYKNWIIELLSQNEHKLTEHYKKLLRKEYISYIKFSDIKSPKQFLKDILVLININWIVRIHKI